MVMSDREAWEYFCANGLNMDDGSNVVYDFPKMTKRFGKAYIDYLAAAYAVKDEMTDEDFCRLNGNVPLSFLSKLPVVETVVL